jgi:protein involved in polysaccharide export with SLBB domain/capsular polysaccharide biosynthesis protein
MFTADFGSLIVPAAKRWPWLIVGALLGAVAGLALGLSSFKQGYTATAKLRRYVPPMATDAYNPDPVSVPTLVHLIQSPDFFLRVGRKLTPPVSGGAVASRLVTVPERNTEILSVIADGQTPADAVKLANLYGSEVMAYAKEKQREDALQAEGNVAQQLKETERDIEAAKKEIPATPVANPLSRFDQSTPGASANPSADRLALRIQAAEDKLAELVSRYTDQWPAVKQQRAELEALYTQAAAARRAAAATAAPTPENPNPDSATSASQSQGASFEEHEVALFRLRSFESLRTMLINKQHAIERFKSDPPGNFRIEMPAAMDNVYAHRSWLKIVLLTIFCGMIGMVIAGGEMLGRELLDKRLKTEGDVSRVTELPVIASLGDLRKMSLTQREDWAFNAWIVLQDRLAFSPNHGLICGVTSSRPGDGRSTWINLLAGAARKCGFRVLTIATQPTPVPAPGETTLNGTANPPPVGQLKNNGVATISPARADIPRESLYASENQFASESQFTAMTASALFSPAEVTEKLMGPESDPLVHIPLPGWTWNLERRKQWQDALSVWRKIDNVVILVELPPASVHESVLLASNLPNVLWLVDAGKSEAPETRTQLQTLRHARCNLVGTVINRAPTPSTHGRFARWIGCLAPFVVALGMTGNSLLAQETPRPASAVSPEVSAASATTFSIVSPQHRAAWQTHYTLGPGDILNFALYGDAQATREEVPVGPDGKISYLEATNVQAAGLTVDELRDKVNGELGRFRRQPQVYIVPVAYRSKKYYMLGKVAQRGAFPLDRPMTLIEAVARARGVETGLASDRSLVELADLQHAFIARKGQHLSVDFQKLFADGDLSQNIALEPDDYIYFPPTDLREVYVLGAVRMPGSYSFNSDVGALGAIAGRGGFTERAWKNRLLVIRGNLGRPETFVIDAKDVLSARASDVKLQPKDIVFVADKPWARAEELLDTAAQAFVQSAVVVWTGLRVDPAIH